MGSDTGFSGTYSFLDLDFRSEESIAGVLGSDIFSPKRVESIAGVFASDIFAPTGVKSKVGRLLAILWRSN